MNGGGVTRACNGVKVTVSWQQPISFDDDLTKEERNAIRDRMDLLEARVNAALTAACHRLDES